MTGVDLVLAKKEARVQKRKLVEAVFIITEAVKSVGCDVEDYNINRSRVIYLPRLAKKPEPIC